MLYIPGLVSETICWSQIYDCQRWQRKWHRGGIERRKVAIYLLLDMPQDLNLRFLNRTNTIWNSFLIQINLDSMKIPKTLRMFNSRGKCCCICLNDKGVQFFCRERSSTRQMRNSQICNCQKSKLFLSSRNISALYSGSAPPPKKMRPILTNRCSPFLANNTN